MNNDSAKILKSINIIACLVIFVLSYLFVIIKLSSQTSWQELSHVWHGLSMQYVWPMLLFMLLLMMVNWSVETIKWRYLMQRIYPLSFLSSLKSVLAGVSVSVIFPNRAGDFIGRAFLLPQGYALQGTFATWVGNISQLIITMCWGVAGVVYAWVRCAHSGMQATVWPILLAVLLVLVILALWAYFSISSFTRFLRRFKVHWVEYVAQKLSFLEQYSHRELSRVLLLSCTRYAIFVFQLYLALRLFAVNTPFGPAIGISCLYFLLTTITPTWVLSEIGVRASVAILLFGPVTAVFPSLGLSEVAVIFPTILLWCVNVVLPAVAGSFFVLKLKLFR